MRRRLARPLTLASLPLLALSAVALSGGAPVPPAGGGSGGTTATAPPGSAGTSAGTTGSTPSTTGSGGTTGSPVGDPSGGWTVEHCPSGTNSFNASPIVPWGNPSTPGAWYAGGTDSEAAGITSTTSESHFAQSSGSVGLRFTYSGSNPPAVSWVAVTSTASWQSDNGSGTASNGLGAVLKNSADGKGGTASSTKVYRVEGTSYSTSVGVNALANVSSSDGSLMGARASIAVAGFLTDKNASLSRPGGGLLDVADVQTPTPQNRYTANTLLSWDDSDNVEPGPNYQSLTGTYGGTWTKLSDGTTDAVNITWSGALGGALGFAPNPGEDHHTTTYPASSTGGKMPLADLSGAKKTQDWKYTVSDVNDGTELDLTCHWICHYAYDNYQEVSANYRDGDVGSVYSVNLTSTNQTGSAQIYAGSLTEGTSFSATSSSGSGSIPGFAAVGKHVGIAAFLARIGRTTSYSWTDGSSPQTWSEIFGDGEYGIQKQLRYKAHVGTVTAWNAKGESQQQTIEYDLDNEAMVRDVSVTPPPKM